MRLLSCPNCARKKISLMEKLKITVDGERFECEECGATFGSFLFFRFFIGVMAAAIFFFSFAYFFGNYGFLYGLLLSLTCSFIVFIFLSSIFPLFRLKRKITEVTKN